MHRRPRLREGSHSILRHLVGQNTTLKPKFINNKKSLQAYLPNSIRFQCTCEYRHFWHLTLAGSAQSGNICLTLSTRTGLTSSGVFSTLALPNGTLVWNMTAVGESLGLPLFWLSMDMNLEALINFLCSSFIFLFKSL